MIRSITAPLKQRTEHRHPPTRQHVSVIRSITAPLKHPACAVPRVADRRFRDQIDHGPIEAACSRRRCATTCAVSVIRSITAPLKHLAPLALSIHSGVSVIRSITAPLKREHRLRLLGDDRVSVIRSITAPLKHAWFGSVCVYVPCGGFRDQIDHGPIEARVRSGTPRCRCEFP